MTVPRFDAFVSYSHAADGRLAPAVQRALHQLARPWYRMRALRVFRDKTSLAVTAGLWPEIERALAASRYLVLLASPDAAVSPWVQREVQWWLDNRSASTILIAVTGGQIQWDTAGGDFDWTLTDAVPRLLHGRFPDEPLWADLRFARDQDRLTLRHSEFRDAMVTLAAPMHGKDKDEIESDDVRQHRRTVRLAAAAMAIVLALAVTATVLGNTAMVQRDHADAARQTAEAARRVADARALTGTATALQRIDPGVSRQLAAAAYRLAPDDPEVASAVLAAMTVPKVATLGHRPVSPRAVFAKDGKTIFAGDDRGLSTLDSQTLRRLDTISSLKTADGQEVSVGQVTDLTLGHNGRLLLAHSQTGLWLFNAEDPRHLRPLIVRPSSSPQEAWWGRVAIQPKGTLAAYAKGNTITLLETADPRSPKAAGEIKLDDAGQFAFSPDGRILAIHGHSGGTVGLWDVGDPATPKQVGTLTGAEDDQANTRPPPALAFSPAGLLAFAGAGNTVKLSNVADPSAPAVTATIAAHTEPVTALEFSANGRLLASGSGDATVVVTEVSSAQPATIGTLGDHTSAITAVAFGPDDASLMTTSQDVSLRLWPFADPRRRGGTVSVNGTAIAATADRSLIATSGTNETVVLRNGTGLAPLGSLDIGIDGTTAAFSADGRLLAVASDLADGPPKLLDTSNPSQPRLIATLDKVLVVSAIAMSGDGTMLAVGSTTGLIHLYDIHDPAKPVLRAVLDAIGWTIGLAFHPHRPLLAAAVWGRATMLWDITVSTQAKLLAKLFVHEDDVADVKFSADGKWMATTDRVGTVLLWDVTGVIDAGFTPLPALRTPNRDIPVIDFSPDGTQLAVAQGHQIIRVWDLTASGPRQRIALTRSSSAPDGVLFGPGGKSLIVAGGPGTDLLDLDAAAVAQRLCEGAGQGLTTSQWNEYLPAYPYDPPCGPEGSRLGKHEA